MRSGSKRARPLSYIKLRWETLLDPKRDRILTLAELVDRSPEMNWTPRSSGTAVKGR